METLPSYMIEWIENRPFSSLGAEERLELEPFFSEAEYTRLHLAATAIKESSIPESQLERQAAIKNNLLERFDRKHNRHVVRPTASLFWKVAAVLLLIGFCSLQYMLLRKVSQPRAMAMADHDTVYIIKEVPAETVKEYDTIYLVKEDRNKNTVVRKTLAAHYPGNNNDLAAPAYSDLNVVPLNALDKRQNSRKGRSIKEDTLIKKIGFVSL